MITFFLHKIHKPKRKEDRNKISANSITLKNLLRLSTLCIQNKQDPLQVLFIKSGALQNVEELIKSQNSEKIDKEFIMFVVDFVQELLRNNFKSTKIFKQNFGYKKFGQLLSNYYNGNPSKDLYKTLCNMLVYKGKFHLRKNFLIQNPDIVSLIFNIFSKSSDMKLFSNILHTFLHICRKSTHNTWCCCEAGIVPIFADIFSKHSFSKIADYSVNFFSLLGSYRLTVPELKYFFRTFKNVPQQNQLIYMSLFLTGIQKMCQEESINSGAFFGFNGISSNLVIPKIDNWPSSKGYTFFTWIRVESFNDNTQNNIKYQPRIFSFLTEKGHGIELFFDPNDKDPNDKTANIVIKIATQIGEVFLHKFEEEIESKKWIFLALTQTPEKKSKIKLYIDGFCVSSIDAKSPIFQDYLSKNKIGSNYLIVSPKVDLCIYRENPFFGQMGAIYFLEDVVTDEEISTIYYSSPNLTQKKEKISRELLSNDFPNNEQNNSKLMKKIEKQKYDSKKKSTIKDLRDRENRSEGCITRKQSVKMYSISNIYSKSFLNFNSKACDLEFAYNQAVSSSTNTDAKSISIAFSIFCYVD
ncbi:beach domain-containing protein lvsc [Anaeramoeba ignava]|uniref:Beach domain-containing protein lvsc n=1 Tax=Anaeramoeba ignava TaxID=1746090 RepID=A0A9Q0R521_ANAIG|nr:beach domain-containing protein lvsc [Anaeramoeba ignava]